MLNFLNLKILITKRRLLLEDYFVSINLNYYSFYKKILSYNKVKKIKGLSAAYNRISLFIFIS